MGLEPTTYSLGSCRSTAELHPLSHAIISNSSLDVKCDSAREGPLLPSVGFSGERQGGGVEGLPSIRERSFKPSACLFSALSGALRQSKGRPCEILTHFTGQGKG
jgi:hypothetical protein